MPRRPGSRRSGATTSASAMCGICPRRKLSWPTFARSANAGSRCVPTSVASTTSSSLFRTTDRELGVASAIVNNAGGAFGMRRRVADMQWDAISAVLSVNLTGVIISCREAIRRMSTERGGRGGAIVNVSSVSARLGAPNLWMDYAAAKGGVDAFTTGLALEVAAEGIRVNAVRPGLIATDLHAASGMPDRAERAGRQMPMKRAGTAEEVADAIIWLASPGASYVSGAIVDVAGAR